MSRLLSAVGIVVPYALVLGLTACASLSPAEPASIGPVVAFPGAEGFGAQTRGGRGGQVFYVTHLGDSGEGSLRAAVEADGPRTVVFAVSGTIALKNELKIKNPYITIAGQSAPGDGIALRGHPLVVAADEVIIRYIRVRLGDENGVQDDAVWLSQGRNIILDHISASWSADETLSASQRYQPGGKTQHLTNVTVQWSIISESMNASLHEKGAHGYGSLIRGSYGAKYSWHHNLWAHHRSRMPRPGNFEPASLDPEGPLFDFRNNVFYNWGGLDVAEAGRDYSVPDMKSKSAGGYNVDTDATSRYNFINNAYRRGPNSKGSYAFKEGAPLAKAHFDGNSMDGVVPADPWSLVILDKAGPDYKQGTPFPAANVTTHSVDEAYRLVLAHAGASLSRDAVDRRVVADVEARTGRIIDCQSDVGGWPKLKTLPAPLDTDRDGMPDSWETVNGLDPNAASDGVRLASDGYTHLELYLNSLVP